MMLRLAKRLISFTVKALPVFLACLLGSALLSVPSQAQTATYASRFGEDAAEKAGASVMAVESPARGQEAPALQQVISMRVEGITVQEALRRIAEEAELRLSYGSQAVAVRKKVTLDLKRVTALDAMQAVLRDTGLKLVPSRSGQLVLIRPVEEKARPLGVKTLPTAKKVATGGLQLIQSPQKPVGAIAGTVTDSTTGEPLPGVNVVVEGTQQGASTDGEGAFTITGLEPGTYAVQASFVGYESRTVQGVEVTDNETTAVEIQLVQSTVALDEVVAVGYGTQRETDLTGSVASVSAEEISELSVRNPVEALRGKVSGLNVTRDDGKPGSGGFDVKIRGIGSINSTNPLVIVDGVRRNAGDVNPEDIESVSVLKDAASAAIYGAQASNGVIVITTKSGQRDQAAQVSFETTVGVREAINLPNMLGTQEFLTLGLEARRNDGQTEVPDDFLACDGGGGSCGEGLANTDWMDEVFGTGLEQNYDLSVSGGSSDFNYYVSGGYEQEDGLQIDDTYQKFTLRINSDFDLSDRVRIGETLNLNRDVRDPSHGNRELPIREIPVFPVRDASNPVGGWGRAPGYYAGGNPVSEQRITDQINTNNSVEGTVYGEVDIIEGLYLRGNFAMEYNSGDQVYYRDRYDWGVNSRGQDEFSVEFSDGTNYNVTGTLNFDRSFGSHDVEALAGAETVSQGNGLNLAAQVNNFNVRNPRSLGLATGTPVVSDLTTQNTPYRLVSQFGRVNYAYDGRYLLQVNIRRDGSSKFGPLNQWGIFPGVSAGWRISEEAFMEPVGFVSDLKIRGAYGVLGNDRPVGNFAYIPTFVPVGREVAFGNESTTSGYEYGGFANPEVKWEEIRQLDLGVDASFLEGRLSTTVNYYSKNTSDMLFPIVLPPSSGAADAGDFNNRTLVTTNIGDIQNQGLELELSYQDTAGDFFYDISANGSYNQNEVQNLEGGFIFGGSTQTISGNTSRTEEGRPIGSFFGYETEGIFRSQDEIDALNEQATEMNATEDNPEVFYQDEGTAPGDLIFRDLNGDGRITADDRTFIGNPWPTWNYGLNANVQFRGFDASFFVQGVLDVDILNGNRALFQNFFSDYNTTEQALDRWTPENPDADQPRLTISDPNGNFTTMNDYLVEDGSYLKLRQIQLGYTLPASLVNTVGARDLRVFVSAQNVFTITGYSGTDPEVAGGNTNWGIDFDRYPQSRLYSLGVSLGF